MTWHCERDADTGKTQLADFHDQVDTMVSRALPATLLLPFLLTSFLGRAEAQKSSSPGAASAALQGKVLGADGRPVPGIHVELDDASTAMPVTSTYTQPDGTFELYNIPTGNYEVIAESCDAEVSNPVSVETKPSSLELQLPASNAAASPLDAATSVARMLVPGKAQKFYDRAFASFSASKYDEAEKQLDAALQIDPDFPEALTMQGVIELGKADLAAGQESLEHAIKVDPSASAAYIALAAVYNHEGRFDDAMRASEKGLSLAPRRWQAYLEMAKASIAKSMYHSGLKFIRQAERLGGSTEAEVHLVKAYALVPLKLYKDAKYELQASLARQQHGHVADQAQQMLARLDSTETAAVAAHP